MNLRTLTRTFILLLAFGVHSFGQTPTTADINALKAQLDALKADNETRIQALETQLKALQSQAPAPAAPTTQAPLAPEAAPLPVPAQAPAEAATAQSPIPPLPNYAGASAG